MENCGYVSFIFIKILFLQGRNWTDSDQSLLYLYLKSLIEARADGNREGIKGNILFNRISI